MRIDTLLVEILLTRFEAELLFNEPPSVKLRGKIDACDAALRYLRGTQDEFVRRASLHGSLRETSAMARSAL